MTSYTLLIRDDQVVVQYGDQVRVIHDITDLGLFMADEAKRLGGAVEALTFMCSSTMDFPDEYTKSEKTIALAKVLRKPFDEAAALATKKKAKRARPKSRTTRWMDAAGNAAAALSEIEEALGKFTEACSELRGVQEEYEEWKDNLPENLASSALGEKLQAIVDLGIEDLGDNLQSAIDDARSVIDEAEGAEMPMGFGRD